MKTTMLMGLLLFGCAGSEDNGLCDFDGIYEMGLLPRTEGCGKDSVRVPLFAADQECGTAIDTFTPDGLIHRTGFLSCDPNNGHDVVECEGYASDSQGCSFDLYMRRVEP